ncbi:hypothetical protein [Brevibacillus dissolubilis]|uniref:hypothetical protein n=1 Tax=Brevibacillus dissolubilis TaxID=1844116 RepID=UPI001117550E|nr:hypothetical protein [Brevibacillus dissolubilis]
MIERPDSVAKEGQERQREQQQTQEQQQTREQQRDALLTKLGFRLEGEKAVHSKMEIELPLAELEQYQYAGEKELDAYLKSVLRNQCLVRKTKKDHQPPV